MLVEFFVEDNENTSEVTVDDLYDIDGYIEVGKQISWRGKYYTVTKIKFKALKTITRAEDSVWIHIGLKVS